MKTIHITILIAAVLLTAGPAFARGGRGAGYGGPPQTDAERAARQEQCQNSNAGTCDGQGQGQGKRARRGQGQGQGQGSGQGNRRGARDGSGPRGGGAGCPAGN